MTFVINPGTEDIAGASKKNAIENIKHLVSESCPDAKIKRIKKHDGGGRYGFIITNKKRHCTILMPGLPLEQVRFMLQKEQDIWQFPRLYVDRSSWLWFWALSRVKERLNE